MEPLLDDAQARRWLRRILADALDAVRGDRLVERLGRPSGGHWRITSAERTLDWTLPAGRLVVVGAGKACGALAKGLESVLGDRIDDGCIITKYGHCEPLVRIRQFEAGHPLPDKAGLDATGALLRTLEGLSGQDRVIVLLTGGASALMVAPVEGVTLEEKAAVTDMLLRSRASIEEINCVRTKLSRIKGGGLLDHIAPAQALTLLLSDVPSGDHGAIGSGPTIAPSGKAMSAIEIVRRHGLHSRLPPSILEALHKAPAPPRPGSNETVVVGDNGTLVDVVRRIADREGLPLIPVDLRMNGDTHSASRAMAAALKDCPASMRPALFVSAGETTLQVSGNGKGGRNQEFALAAAMALEGVAGAALLAVGTDGTDGPTDAAGAFADGGLCARARTLGLDPARTITDNDSNTLFARTGDLIHTGPTGTNLMDIVLGLAF